MKTAEEWADIWLDSGYRHSRIALTEHIKEIQMEAWKQGMIDAAEIALPWSNSAALIKHELHKKTEL